MVVDAGDSGEDEFDEGGERASFRACRWYSYVCASTLRELRCVPSKALPVPKGRIEVPMWVCVFATLPVEKEPEPFLPCVWCVFGRDHTLALPQHTLSFLRCVSTRRSSTTNELRRPPTQSQRPPSKKENKRKETPPPRALCSRLFQPPPAHRAFFSHRTPFRTRKKNACCDSASFISAL